MPLLSSDNSIAGPPCSAVLLGLCPSLHKAVHLLALLLQGLLRFRAIGVPDLAEESADALLKRATRLQSLCRNLLKILGVEVRVSGEFPKLGEAGLLVANHISFVDIMVLSSVQPTVFVSKAEVASWPIIGPIAAAAGTIFIQRQRRADVARANVSLRNALAAGLRVTLFPEGTSSDGQSVLPFQPSLLQPAVETGTSITPAYLRYCETDGQRIDEVAYFGDRHLQDCLWALIRRRHTLVTVRFGSTAPREGDRKALALSLYEEVRALAPTH